MSKILIVDDDEDILIELEEMLTELGFTCLSETDVTRALEIKRNHPDIGLIVTDLRMPGQSGLRLVKTINELNDGQPPTPIIVMSGHADMDDVISLFRNGVIDFLPKPIYYEHLLKILDRVFPDRIMAAE